VSETHTAVESAATAATCHSDVALDIAAKNIIFGRIAWPIDSASQKK
jgi:hypothetical protein